MDLLIRVRTLYLASGATAGFNTLPAAERARWFALAQGGAA